MHSVSEGYFEAMGATIARGRAFTAFDNKDSAGAVIVNEAFARRYLSDGDPVGQVVRTWATGIGPLGTNLKSPPNYRPPPEGMPSEIVGVVKDVNNVPLGQTVEPAIYFTTRQFPFSEVFIAVQATDRSMAQTAIRNALRKVVPNVPMSATQTWGERFAAKTAEARLLMTILLFFGGLAALLAALGVYGLFSWSVALRTRELAIRLTLGAKPSSVGALVIGQSAVLVVDRPGGRPGDRAARRKRADARGLRRDDDAMRWRSSRRARCCWSRRSSRACRRRCARCASIRSMGCGGITQGRESRLLRVFIDHTRLKNQTVSSTRHVAIIAACRILRRERARSFSTATAATARRCCCSTASPDPATTGNTSSPSRSPAIASSRPICAATGDRRIPAGIFKFADVARDMFALLDQTRHRSRQGDRHERRREHAAAHGHAATRRASTR